MKVANTTNGEKILYELYPIEKVEAAWKPGTSTTNNRVTQPDAEVKNFSDRESPYQIDRDRETDTRFSLRESVEETTAFFILIQAKKEPIAGSP